MANKIWMGRSQKNMGWQMAIKYVERAHPNHLAAFQTSKRGARASTAKWFGWALSTYFIGICHPIFFWLLPIHILLAGGRFIFYWLPCKSLEGKIKLLRVPRFPPRKLKANNQIACRHGETAL